MSSKIKRYVKKYQLTLFFIISYLISWTVWIPQAFGRLGISESSISPDSPLNLIAVWGPALAAIILSALVKGKAGLRELFSPIKRWRVGIHWYFIVFLFPAAVWFMARALDTLLGQSYELTSTLSELGPEYAMLLPLLVIFAIPSALGEEVGWRGFALPQLQEKYNAIISSVIIGSFWGIWHIPTWIAQGFFNLILVKLIISIILYSILFVWIFNSSNGSLFLVLIFHSAITITGYFLAPLPTLTEYILLLLAVVLVIIFSGPKHLSKKHKS